MDNLGHPLWIGVKFLYKIWSVSQWKENLICHLDSPSIRSRQLISWPRDPEPPRLSKIRSCQWLTGSLRIAHSYHPQTNMKLPLIGGTYLICIGGDISLNSHVLLWLRAYSETLSWRSSLGLHLTKTCPVILIMTAKRPNTVIVKKFAPLFRKLNIKVYRALHQDISKFNMYAQFYIILYYTFLENCGPYP